MMLDIRPSLYVLVDSNSVSEREPYVFASIEDLIADIPSVSILLTFAVVNRQLYLNDKGESFLNLQRDFLFSVLRKDSQLAEKIVEAFSSHQANGDTPIIVSRYSILLIFEEVLSHYNNLPFRELSPEENERVVRLLLVINSRSNSRIVIPDGKVDSAFESGSLENILLPHFIFQRDYVSNSDYTNQVVRGFKLFRHLEQRSEYGPLMSDYYKELNVDNSYHLLTSLLNAVHNILNNKNPVLSITGGAEDPINGGIYDLTFLPPEPKYFKDDSFGFLRRRMLLMLPNNKLLLLDINFLIDHFYKSQIFRLNKFFTERGIKNFLQYKSFTFMEKEYFAELMTRCFKLQNCIFGDALKKTDGNELTDFAVCKDDKILLVELKDVTLAAKPKNSGSEAELFSALDLKLFENERGKQKGAKQLANAIECLSSEGSNFEYLTRSLKKIYPVIIYTDNAFGFDGMNQLYKKRLNSLVNNTKPNKGVIGLTLINLSFFEIHCSYLENGIIDIFRLIDEYHIFITDSLQATTPFEVFARGYLAEVLKIHASEQYLFSETIHAILHPSLF